MADAQLNKDDDANFVTVRRRKRGTGGPRAAAKPTPAFFVLQVLDENGEPMPFPKSRVRFVSIERSAETVLDMVEGGDHPHSFYIRGLVPAGRGTGTRGPRVPTPAA